MSLLDSCTLPTGPWVYIRESCHERLLPTSDFEAALDRAQDWIESGHEPCMFGRIRIEVRDDDGQVLASRTVTR